MVLLMQHMLHKRYELGAMANDDLQVQPLLQEAASQQCLMVRVDFQWVEAGPLLQRFLASKYYIKCEICMFSINFACFTILKHALK